MNQVSWPCSLDVPPQIAIAVTGRWSNISNRHWRTREWWSVHQLWHEGQLTIRHSRLSKPVTVRLHPGMVTIFPPDTIRDWEVPNDGLYSCIHFRLSREGNGKTARLPLAVDPGAGSKALDRQMMECIGCSGHQPARAAAFLWSLLWEMAGHVSPLRPDDRVRELVSKVQAQIEIHLCEQLQVSDLASTAGVSPAHLRRLFKATLGISIRQYLQERWLARTRHLLIFTDNSIKSIAVDMGIPDIHHFNKKVHSLIGKSPSALRNQSPSFTRVRQPG